MKSMFRNADCLLKGPKYQLYFFKKLNPKLHNEKLIYSTLDQIKPDANFYDDLSPIYENVVSINTLGQHSRWRNSFIKHLAPFENIKILDAAGGTGLTTREILNHAAKTKSKLNFSISLCDQSSLMMDKAQNKTEQLKDYKEFVTFVKGDIHNLPFKNDTFDLATFTFSFRTGVNIEQVFKELVRVVKPGGRVGVLDFCYSKNPTTMWNIMYMLWKRPELAYFIADNIRKSPSEGEVVEMLKSAGFSQISTKSHMGGVTYHYIGYKI